MEKSKLSLIPVLSSFAQAVPPGRRKPVSFGAALAAWNATLSNHRPSGGPAL